MSKIIEVPKEETFTVIFDTREKYPWSFPIDKYCLGSKRKKLDTGDYSLEGFEKEIVIEKKRNAAEVSMNLYEKRFEEELKRLDEFEFPYMIFEFNYREVASFPVGSGVPQKLWHHLKVQAEHLEKAIMRYMLKYRTKIIFAGPFGDKVAYKLFKYFLRMKNGKL